MAQASNKKPPADFNKLARALVKVQERPYARDLARTTSRFASKDYDLADINRMIQSLDVASMRKVSRYYYETSASYRRMIDHFAGIYLYYYHLVLQNTDEVSKTEALKKYENALTLLDNFCAGGTLRDLATEVLVSGVAFFYTTTFGKNQSAITLLDPTYCRSRFKSPYNTDLVEFDVKYIDTIKDTEECAAVLEAMPPEVRIHYNRYKLGQEDTSWVVLPAERATAFFLDSADDQHTPPIFDTIIDIMNFDDTKEIEKDKDAQELEKILVQLFEMDDDGDLEMFLEEIAEIHKGTAAMFQDNKYVDVLTSIAKDVKVIDSRASATSSATNNNILKMMAPKYENAGLSSEMFYSTTATALNISIANAASFVGKLNDKFANWLSVFLYGNLSMGKLIPVVEILPVTAYNKDRMVDTYLKAAQSGYSKMLPYIATGGRQSTLLDSLLMENEILELGDQLIPLATSYTQSSKAGEGATSKGGRPPKDDAEKTEQTVKTNDARGEAKNETGPV